MATARTQRSALLEPGVSLRLAQWRSRHYQDVRYRINAVVSAEIDTLSGTLDITLTLIKRVRVILDWRAPMHSHAALETVNGVTVRTFRVENEHILIPAAHLRTGENNLRIRFTAPIAISGAGITRFRDHEDASEYIYSLLVPADASTVFPCFDQPDLKGRFALALDVPAAWQVVANAPCSAQHTNGQRKVVLFQETEPISTYLFAFAAGPFDVLTGNADDPTRLFVRRSRSEEARENACDVLHLNQAAVRFFSSYFDHPFPFAKYDLVLIPEFPYNGMEHAGATFLREDAILFPSVPAVADRLRRCNLLFHETAHQWMGNLVTMRWFDDLWLKEGFANLMAAKAAAALVPELDPWIGFLALKTSAYRTDATAGTTPIRQLLSNLSAAKSSYGNIVYGKGPAILRQAEFAIGEECFQQAVRGFIRRHAYGAANWKDLVRMLEEASGRDLTRWAAAWIKRRGMARISVEWAGDTDSELTNIVIRQADALGEEGVWPQRIRLLLGDEEAGDRIINVTLAGTHMRVSGVRGTKTPSYLLANEEDMGYGLFVLDARSRSHLQGALAGIRSPLRRALIWSAMWDSVREGAFTPVEFLELAIDGLTYEDNEITFGTLTANMQVAFRWYLSEAKQAELAPVLEQALLDCIAMAETAGLRATLFRTLAATAMSAAGLAALKALFSNQRCVPDLRLSLLDRHRIVQRLVMVADPAAAAFVDAVTAQSEGDEGRRYLYGTASAWREGKATSFDGLSGDRSLPESWIEGALGPFNVPEHADVTLPFLTKALDLLPRLKRERRIFFVNRWLGAFIGGQRSAAALTRVQQFLDENPMLDLDLRCKVLEATGELARTVSIRNKFAQ